MSHLSQATPQSIGVTRRRGSTSASRSVNESAIIGDPRCVDQWTTAHHLSRTSSVPDVPDSPASSCGGYSSASEWLKKKNFGASGRQRSDSHLSQRRRSSAATPYPTPKTQTEQPSPDSVDDWFKRYFETPDQQTASRRARDNTLRHLEYDSCPSVFHIDFQGQPGISIQKVLSKWRFDRGDTPLGQLINFRVVNPPIRFKLPDGTFARHTVRSVKISDSMTVCEFCTRVAGKMGTSLDDEWDVKNLTMVSLELAQNSVICSLGSTSPVV